jgi:hypothetical protein
LATEAAMAFMQYGFDRFHFTRLVAVAQPANLQSIRVMEKLGMTFEKPLTYKGVEVVCYARENPAEPAGRTAAFGQINAQCVTRNRGQDEQRRLITG